jgi:hypothetical protein
MITTRAIVMLFAAILMLGGTPATAQGENDLQRQVDALKEQVRRKDIDLQVLAAKVTELEAKLADCERRSAPRPDGAPAPAVPTEPMPEEPAAPPVAPDPSVPAPAEPLPPPADPLPPVAPDQTAATGDFASPDAMLDAARLRLREDFGARLGSSDPKERAGYQRDLKGWTATLGRTMRREVVWPVRLIDATSARSGRIIVQAMVLDAEGRERGACTIELMGAAAKAWRSTPVAGRCVNLRGLAALELTIDLDQQEPRPFRNDRFIGPCLEGRVVVTQAVLGT